MRIVIVFFKYNTFYFTYPHENTISAIFCRLVCFLSPNLANIIHLLYFYIIINGWRRFQRRFHQFWNSAVYFIFDIVSFDISSNCRHFNGSPLLCPINATSSFSYVFTLHYPRVLHCRIVPIQKLKKIFVLGRKKPPITVVLSEFKRSNLKVTRKFAKTPRGLLDRGVNIFTKRLFATTAI